MKYYLAVFLVIIAGSVSYAVGDFLWAQRAGGADFEEAISIAVDTSGNTYITGFFNGTSTFGTTSLVATGAYDIFVAKISVNGNFLWAKQAGGTAEEYGYKIAVDGAGNVYITGSFEGTATFGATNLLSSGFEDVFIAKLDTNGNFLWAKKAGGTLIDMAYGLAADSSGNVYVIGFFEGAATFGATNLIATGYYDLFVAKLDTNGNFLWAKQAGGTTYVYGYDVAVDTSGNVYVIGFFEGAATFGAYNLISAGSYDIFTTKLDTNGNFLWATKAGGTISDHGYGIAVDASGNVYVTGYFQDTATFGTVNLVSTGNYDVFIAKLDTSGTFLWAKGAGSTSTDYGIGIAADGSGNAYATGYFCGTGTFGTTDLVSAGGYDIFVAMLDASGNFLWAIQAGGAGDDYGNSLAIDGSDNAYLTGNFEEIASFGSFNLVSGGYEDVFVAKLEDVLAAPILLSPANASVDQPIDVPLRWQDTNTAKLEESGYGVRWREQGAGSYNTHDVGAGVTTYAPGVWDYYTSYEWNVKALGNGTTIPDSDWANEGVDWTFRTTGIVLHVPVLDSPADGAIDQPLASCLYWVDTNSSPNETGCRLRIKPQGSGTYSYYDMPADTAAYAPPGLDYNTCYYWNVKFIGNGTTILDSNYANSGVDWSFVTVCTNTTADAGPDKHIPCGETTVTIGGSPTASGGDTPYTYDWTPATGLNDTTIANPEASPGTTTTYTVVVTDTHGCTDTDSVLVTKIEGLPAPTITYPTNGVVDVPIAPDITWDQVLDNEGYRLYLEGPDLTATEVDIAQDTTHYQVPQATFSYGFNYSIKLKTLGDGSNTCTGAYGSTHTFTIQILDTRRFLPFAFAGDKTLYRTNVGLFELSSCTLISGITCLSSTGAGVAQHDYQVNAWAYLPIADIITALGVSQDASIDIDADGPFLSIGGIIDNYTNDPSVTGSELAQFSQGFTPLILKTLEWHTHVVIRNLSSSQATVVLSAYAISGGTTPQAQYTIYISGNGFFSADDIITYMGGNVDTVWLLDIDADQTVCGYARQYNSSRTGGIYPFYAHGQGATTLVFPYMEDTVPYRSNIGISRTAAGGSNVTLKYYSGGGLQASRTTGVSQNQYIPIINSLRWIRNSVSPDPLDESGYVVIEADAPIYAIGGPTDNISNDPSVQGAAYTAFADTIAPIVLKSGPWATRVVLTNHSASSVDVTIQLVYDGSVVDSSSTSISAYDQLIYDDIIDNLFPAYVYGTLRIVASDPIYVYVHQYTNANTGGLYPVFNTEDYD